MTIPSFLTGPIPMFMRYPSRQSHLQSLPLQVLIRGMPIRILAVQIVNIPANLPEGTGSGSLEIYDIHGRKILSYPLSTSSTNVQLSASQLASGTYLYQIAAGDRISEARKIVIR